MLTSGLVRLCEKNLGRQVSALQASMTPAAASRPRLIGNHRAQIVSSSTDLKAGIGQNESDPCLLRICTVNINRYTVMDVVPPIHVKRKPFAKAVL